jgi:hypothetical protein
MNKDSRLVKFAVFLFGEIDPKISPFFSNCIITVAADQGEEQKKKNKLYKANTSFFRLIFYGHFYQ